MFDSSNTPGFVLVNPTVWAGTRFEIIESDSNCGPGTYNITSLTWAMATGVLGGPIAMNVSLWRKGSVEGLYVLIASFTAPLVWVPSDSSPRYVTIALSPDFLLDSSSDVPGTSYAVAVMSSVSLRWHYVLTNGTTLDRPSGVYGDASGAITSDAAEPGPDAATEIVGIPGARLGAWKVSCAASATTTQTRTGSPTSALSITASQSNTATKSRLASRTASRSFSRSGSLSASQSSSTSASQSSSVLQDLSMTGTLSGPEASRVRDRRHAHFPYALRNCDGNCIELRSSVSNLCSRYSSCQLWCIRLRDWRGGAYSR